MLFSEAASRKEQKSKAEDCFSLRLTYPTPLAARMVQVGVKKASVC